MITWEKAHRTNSKRILTGTTWLDLKESFGLGDPKGLRILNVGVGFGYVEQSLYELGADIESLDVCQAALDKGADVGYISPLDLLHRHYDWVLVNYVAMHLSDDDFKRDVQHWWRSCRGTMWIQWFKELPNNKQTASSIIAIGRTPEYAAGLMPADTQCGPIVRLRKTVETYVLRCTR